MLGAFSTFLLVGCGATTLISTPVENIDTVPLKVAELTEAEKTMEPCGFVADTILFKCRQSLHYYLKTKRSIGGGCRG